MIILLATLACTGLLLLLVSRFLLMRQTATLHWALRAAIWLPFADLTYLAGRWQKHKVAALFSVLGAALFLPLGGQLLWETQHPELLRAKLSIRAQVSAMLKTDLASATAAAEKERQDRLWMSKSAKVDELTAYLATWHASMQSRRAGLVTSPADVVLAFNHEAESYHAFLRVARAEKDALAAMPAPEGTTQTPARVD